MTKEQIHEADKCVSLLNECREHLDNAMYRMGGITDEEYAKLRRVYDHICKALDEY